MKIKTYSEMIQLPTFEERFRYLKLGGGIGVETFGSDRYLNQRFYNSPEWKSFRDKVIIRDNGCDLAFEEYVINGSIIIHHLNPLSIKDILDRNPALFDMENVVCVSHRIHNAIHYGDESLLYSKVNVRKKNDQCPWKN